MGSGSQTSKNHPASHLGKSTAQPTPSYSGIALAAYAIFSQGASRINHPKIAVKLLIALAVFVFALIGARKQRHQQPVSTGQSHGVGGGALINTIIACMWQ